MIKKLFYIFIATFIFVNLVNAELKDAGLLTYNLVGNYSVSTNNLLLDASGEKAAFIFQVAKTGSISKVSVRTGTVTTGDTLLISLQDVTLTTGAPDEVVDESATLVVADSDDNIWATVTLDAARSVTAGQYLAVVVEYNSYVAGNMNILSNTSLGNRNTYANLKTGGTWTIQSRSPLVVLEYTGTNFYPHLDLQSTVAGATLQLLNTGTTPDEIGNVFTSSVPATIVGAQVYGRVTSDANVNLYSNDGTTVLATGTINDTVCATCSSDNFVGVYFSSPLDIKPNMAYRLVYTPTTATSNGIYISATLLDSGNMLDGETVYYSTSRTNAGAWTDVTTKVNSIYPIFSRVDNAAYQYGGAQ